MRIATTSPARLLLAALTLAAAGATSARAQDAGPSATAPVDAPAAQDPAAPPPAKSSGKHAQAAEGKNAPAADDKHAHAAEGKRAHAAKDKRAHAADDKGARAAEEQRGHAAGDKHGHALAERVQRYYRAAKDFSAQFDQRYTYVAFGRTQESSGSVQVKRPGLLRWETQKPEKQVIVLDGAAYWLYSPEDNQVTVKRHFVSDQLSTAFTFLWGKGNLTDEFEPHAATAPEGLPKGDAIELLPRKPGGPVQKLLFVVGKTGQVLASVVTDPQGNLNQLTFHDAKLNGALPDSLFKFEPPKGANVQELQ